MKRVAIFPPWDPWRGNRMFDVAEGCIYSVAFRQWREAAAGQGFRLDTADVCPAEEADVLWFMDLPRRRATYEAVCRKAKTSCRKVLQVLESPLFFPAAFVEANRKCFDAVVSYEYTTDSHDRFAGRLPVQPEPQYEGPDFGQRRLAVMVNTNRIEGWLSTRKSGLVGLPGIGGYFSGWKMPKRHWWEPAQGELYSWRRRLAVAAENGRRDDLDIFGPGWQGEAVSWFPLANKRSYLCHRTGNVERDASSPKQDKRARLSNYRFVIAVENCRNSRGYISEKIFDAMLGGSVPVYLGEAGIGDIVPRRAFVDAGVFKSPDLLLKYLTGMSREEWQEMRVAGRDFVQSERFMPFTGTAFAARMTEILTKVSGGSLGAAESAEATARD